MIKGAQKRMIVVKTGDSAVFEEVYFVMRRESSAEKIDMLAEANKIIENCGCNRKKALSAKSKTVIFTVCSFLSGGLFGGALAILLYALI